MRRPVPFMRRVVKSMRRVVEFMRRVNTSMHKSDSDSVQTHRNAAFLIIELVSDKGKGDI